MNPNKLFLKMCNASKYSRFKMAAEKSETLITRQVYKTAANFQRLFRGFGIHHSYTRYCAMNSLQVFMPLPAHFTPAFHISTGRHPIISIRTFHMPKPPQSTMPHHLSHEHPKDCTWPHFASYPSVTHHTSISPSYALLSSGSVDGKPKLLGSIVLLHLILTTAREMIFVWKT